MSIGPIIVSGLQFVQCARIFTKHYRYSDWYHELDQRFPHQQLGE